MTIYNRPETPYRYEFEVVIPVEEDTYMHIGFYTNGFEAEKKALMVGGIIIHDVRVQGKVRA
jgi:hypothetical protein